jgi:hypothetical protein
MASIQTMRDVPITFRFSPRLELDVMFGRAGSPSQVGRYATHHKCPQCGWFVPLTLEGRAALLVLGLTLTGAQVINNRLHFSLAFEQSGVFLAAQCGHCGLDEAGIYVTKGNADIGGRKPN